MTAGYVSRRAIDLRHGDMIQPQGGGSPRKIQVIEYTRGGRRRYLLEGTPDHLAPVHHANARVSVWIE